MSISINPVDRIFWTCFWPWIVFFMHHFLIFYSEIKLPFFLLQTFFLAPMMIGDSYGSFTLDFKKTLNNSMVCFALDGCFGSALGISWVLYLILRSFLISLQHSKLNILMTSFIAVAVQLGCSEIMRMLINNKLHLLRI